MKWIRIGNTLVNPLGVCFIDYKDGEIRITYTSNAEGYASVSHPMDRSVFLELAEKIPKIIEITSRGVRT